MFVVALNRTVSDARKKEMLLTLIDFYVIIDRKRDKNLRDSEIMSIFAPSESTTLPIEQRTRVELFLFVVI